MAVEEQESTGLQAATPLSTSLDRRKSQASNADAIHKKSSYVEVESPAGRRSIAGSPGLEGSPNATKR